MRIFVPAVNKRDQKMMGGKGEGDLAFSLLGGDDGAGAQGLLQHIRGQ